MKKILIILMLFSFINMQAFCYATNSIYIQNISKKQATEAILNNKLRENWTVLNANEYSILLRQNMTGMNRVLFGSDFNPTPERRLQYNLVQNGNGIVISINGEIVTNPRSGYEKAITCSEESILQEIDYLNKLFNGYYSYGIDYVKWFKTVIVTNVYTSMEGGF